MFRVKRLYLFILQTFLPVFLATFGVCLFILLMQFLWRYVDDMVGKGLDLSILGELFFYAALNLVPMALPLSILLASLMAFGNLGEKLELLAMKSAGISLLRIMRPLIVFLSLVAIGAFYFQNVISPASQVKFYTLLFSIRQKSPELDIPEGVFYKEIEGYNVYVGHKNRETGMMENMMIYDYSKGFENAIIIVADSGRLKSSEDKLYLILTLYNGESFENLKQQQGRSMSTAIPYRRETFSLKEILIKFDANFNMNDESIVQGRDVSKNVNQLFASIDSIKVKSDSVNNAINFGFRRYVYTGPYILSEDSLRNLKSINIDTFELADFDSFILNKTMTEKIEITNRAKSKAESMRNDYQYQSFIQKDQQSLLRGHKIELHRKFTLSVACLVFFFIGAPLGAIIRKGGLGMPAVISVFLFIFYYTIDIIGLKIARQGVVPVWEGMWQSSFVLFCLGFFLTYKAVNDSTMFNIEAWGIVLRRIFGKRESRNYQKKEVIITLPDYQNDLKKIHFLSHKCQEYITSQKKLTGYISFWKNGYKPSELKDLVNNMEMLIEDLKNSDQNLIIAKLMDYPIVMIPQAGIFKRKGLRYTFALLFPIGIIIYFIWLMIQKKTRQDINSILKINQDLEIEIQKLLK